MVRLRGIKMDLPIRVSSIQPVYWQQLKQQMTLHFNTKAYLDPPSSDKPATPSETQIKSRITAQTPVTKTSWAKD